VLALQRGRLLPGYAAHFARLCVRGLTEDKLRKAVMEAAD
jgi:hypothetical protein